jgi:S1-C subfamily serine protease
MTKIQQLASGLLLTLLLASACVQSPPTPSNAPSTISTGTGNTTTRLLNEARGFVYRVRTVACLGTGTSFAVNGVIVTNRHVASGSTSLQLATWDGNDFTESVSALSTSADLALLTGTSGPTHVVLAAADPAAGTSVWVTGYPEGNQLSSLPGVITDYVSGGFYGEPSRIMEISNAIEPGNSGSPVLNAAGQVVGVVFAISHLDGAGLAIPVTTLRSFLSDPGNNTSGQCIE